MASSAPSQDCLGEFRGGLSKRSLPVFQSLCGERPRGSPAIVHFTASLSPKLFSSDRRLQGGSVQELQREARKWPSEPLRSGSLWSLSGAPRRGASSATAGQRMAKCGVFLALVTPRPRLEGPGCCQRPLASGASREGLWSSLGPLSSAEWGVEAVS